jgi:hypothetical protein
MINKRRKDPARIAGIPHNIHITGAETPHTAEIAIGPPGWEGRSIFNPIHTVAVVKQRIIPVYIMAITHSIHIDGTSSPQTI